MEDSTDKLSKLPNAPLVEVVFELRWDLLGESNSPNPFKQDPGYNLLVDSFSVLAGKKGFGKIEKFPLPGNFQPAYSISHRYRQDDSSPHPMLQIGPGIFAANESSSYEWKRFKRLVMTGIDMLFNSYPKMNEFKLTPNLLELHYIDSLSNENGNSHINLPEFLNNYTELSVKLPEFFSKKPIGKKFASNFVFLFPVTFNRHTNFKVQIANANLDKNSGNSILLDSRVTIDLAEANFGKTQQKLENEISTWLDEAHNVTSNFFRQFVNEELMNKYRQI